MSAKAQRRFRKFVPTDVALDIVQAMDHPGLFKQWFDGPSWVGWRAVLKAAFCLSMTTLTPVVVLRKWGPHHFHLRVVLPGGGEITGFTPRTRIVRPVCEDLGD